MRPKFVITGVVVLAIVIAAGLILTRRGEQLPIPRPNPSQERPPEGEISIAYPEEPASLNPYSFAGESAATRDLLRPVLPTLLQVSPELRYRPRLATAVPRLSTSSGAAAVTFRIDPEAVWSDGTPITAGDVRFTWETLRAEASAAPARATYHHVSDVVIVNAKTVKLVLAAPFTGWRDLFSAGDFILPRHILEGKDVAAELAGGVAFSGGPYTLTAWTRGLEMTFEPNPRWWRNTPRIKRVRVFFVADINTAVELLEQKRMDALWATTQVNLRDRLEAIEGVRVASRFGAAWWELGFNLDCAPCSALAFRQAMGAAVDRGSFVEALVKENGRTLDHLAPGRKVESAFSGVTRDLARVQELLGQAGFRSAGEQLRFRGRAPTLSTPSRNEMAGLLQTSYRRALRDAGMLIELRTAEAPTFYGDWLRDGDFEAALVERRATPHFSPRRHYHSAFASPAGGNYTRTRLQEVDAAVERAELQGDLNAMMEELSKGLPTIPLLEVQGFIAHREEISGPDPNVTAEGPFWNLEAWERAR